MAPDGHTGDDAPPRARDGWIIAGALLILYCVLAQGSFYKTDGQALLWLRQNGALGHGYHTFYLPLLAALEAVCRPLGLTLFETATLLSALGTALGVAIGHAALRRLDLSRLGCNVAALLVGLCPGVVFFATVVEVHGPFLPFASLALLALVHAAALPGWRRGILAGLSAGLAYLAHPTGALMPAMLPVLACAAARGRRPALREILAPCLAAGAALLAWLVIVPPLARRLAGARVDAGKALDVLWNFAGAGLAEPLRTARVLGLEFVLPLLPASLLALAALGIPRARAAAAWLLVAALAYTLAAQLMLAGFSERGAYFLPLAWPAALVSLEILHRRRSLVPAALALAAAAAVAQVRLHDRPERPAAFAEGLRTIAAGHAGFLLIAGHPLDVEAYLVRFEHAPMLHLGPRVGLPPDGAAAALVEFDDWIAQARARDLVVVLSRRALDLLRDAAKTGEWLLSHDPVVRVPAPAAARILEHLTTRYTLQPATAAGFDGFVLRPRA